MKPFSWDRAESRTGKFDGKFLIGVLTTGIYCLPSCPVHPPKPENVRLFRTEDEAKAAGLRACKRCRPDLFYRGEDGDVQLFDGLAARVRGTPQAFANAAALATAAGVSQTKLGDLFRRHAHLAPAAWLRREHIKAAQHALLHGDARVVEIGYDSGFESESVFHRQFLALTRMTPGAYRALKNASVFLLALPPGYRAQEVLAYHGRDPDSLCERSEGQRIWKALTTDEGPCVLEISIESEGAWCRVHADTTLSQASMGRLHAAALRMLGLNNEVAAFERRVAADPALAVFRRRRGMRVPTIPTGFDGLCWAIIGQQINLKFAAALRREIIHLGGERVGAMIAHPSPARVADIGAAALTSRRFSRSKASYLIGAATAVVQGGLAIEALSEGSAVAAESALTALHGVGTWTARYVMLRGGFADCAPVGDSALATALQRMQGHAERPAYEDVHRLMETFSPHRSLATAHLWASLKDVS